MLVTSELSRDPRVQKEAQIAFDNGYDVTVICRTYLGEPQQYKVLTLGIDKPESLLGKIVERSLSQVIMLIKVLGEHPDLIHANDLDTLPVAYIAGKISGAKVVYDSHELWPDVNKNLKGVAASLANWLQRVIVNRIAGSITVNSSLGELMAKRLGIDPPLVIRNAPYLTPNRKLQIGTWLKQFEGKRVVLYQGRYIPNRGIPDVLEAAKYLPNDVIVAFRGYGPLEEEMRLYVERHRLEERIHFLEPVPMDHLVQAAVGADLGLVLYDPSNESHINVSPNKFFEFMMAGVPMVCSDMPFLRKMSDALGVGRVYTSGNPKMLADVIVSILNARDEHILMQENCMKWRETYCWENEGRNLVELYHEILA